MCITENAIHFWISYDHLNSMAASPCHSTASFYDNADFGIFIRIKLKICLIFLYVHHSNSVRAFPHEESNQNWNRCQYLHLIFRQDNYVLAILSVSIFSILTLSYVHYVQLYTVHRTKKNKRFANILVDEKRNWVQVFILKSNVVFRKSYVPVPYR